MALHPSVYGPKGINSMRPDPNGFACPPMVPALLTAEFLTWANSKLRILAFSRVEDAALGSALVNHSLVLKCFMDDFDQQAFALPTFPAYLSYDGGARFTREEIRKKEFPDWLSRTLYDKTKNGALGHTCAVYFFGYYVGQEDRMLRQFSTSGHVNHSTSPSWQNTNGFVATVLSNWEQFVLARAPGRVVHKLPPIPSSASSQELKKWREMLRVYLELMFMLQTNTFDLDCDAFWRKVMGYPNRFVAPRRLPRGITFSNPVCMSDDDFRAVYEHLRLCQSSRESIPTDARFIYDPTAVAKHLADRIEARIEGHTAGGPGCWTAPTPVVGVSARVPQPSISVSLRALAKSSYRQGGADSAGSQTCLAKLPQPW
ncbi:hypothetical protein AURDEDRAFT_131405 [Auricularia subglabra TFB-10046 SS5]|uniref:Uncharacterized protein n=1 Tax=Auricularia subglabra (strain TFB-10046 / SS5) TaxID=717982 RepID=J0LBZ7_AURST|nr:hypothetical protein AURDEDRAFT_131405 [Auricularia subglabra TFB-10046 SS5]